jgi:hypothetical protein
MNAGDHLFKEAIMALSKVRFAASPSSTPETRYIQDGLSVGEYLEEVEGITSLSNVTVEVNGEAANLNADVEDGDTITLAQKKTASGCV